MRISTFDIDGVIFISPEVGGVHPGPNDVIITGRSFEEQPETERMLHRRGIYNNVLYNPLPFDQKTRETSGHHKARCIKGLQDVGYEVVCHYDDDEIQAAIIREECPGVNLVMLVHDLTEKENVRHTDYF